MKNLKVFMSACLLACSTMASAQFMTGGNVSGSTTTTVSTSVGTEGWNKIYVSYDPMTLNVDKKNEDDWDFTGFSAGYLKGFSVSQSMPLFLEAGIGLGYATYTNDDNEDVEYKYNLLSLKVPVNLTYKFAIPNSKVVIAPYAGVSLRFNIVGKRKCELSSDMQDKVDAKVKEWEEEYKDAQERYEDDPKKFSEWLNDEENQNPEDTYDDVNMLDEDEVKDRLGSKDAAWKRFQFGWQIGANVEVGQNFVVGVQYGKDLSEICEDYKLSTTSISVGYKF